MINIHTLTDVLHKDLELLTMNNNIEYNFISDNIGLCYLIKYPIQHNTENSTQKIVTIWIYNDTSIDTRLQVKRAIYDKNDTLYINYKDEVIESDIKKPIKELFSHYKSDYPNMNNWLNS